VITQLDSHSDSKQPGVSSKLLTHDLKAFDSHSMNVQEILDIIKADKDIKVQKVFNDQFMALM